MKPPGHLPQNLPQRAPCRHRGFTLPEVMVTLAIFSMVVLAVVSVNIFGFRMIELTEPKLLAGAEARLILNTFIDDVKGANRIEILPGPDGKLRNNTLTMEWWLSDRTNIIEYVFEPALAELIRSERVQGIDGSEVVRLLAAGVADLPDDPVFACEDHHGTVLIETQRRMVVAMRIQFMELFPTEFVVGDAGRFKDYQLRTKVAFRSH